MSICPQLRSDVQNSQDIEIMNKRTNQTNLRSTALAKKQEQRQRSFSDNPTDVEIS
jgi:hypothetical protein